MKAADNIKKAPTRIEMNIKEIVERMSSLKQQTTMMEEKIGGPENKRTNISLKGSRFLWIVPFKEPLKKNGSLALTLSFFL